MTPLVSVVVPTHNRASLLARTVRSIARQNLFELEIIVVDDGSSDASAVTACSVDARVRVIRHAHALGVSAARNRGVAEARGQWIAFCDDDDVWSPEKLELQIAEAERTRAAWAYGGDVNVDAELRVLSGGPPPDPSAVVHYLPAWNPISSGGSNVIVRADQLSAIGGFDVALHRTEDWDLWIRLARSGPPAWVCAPLVAYRFHGGNAADDPGSMVTEAAALASRHQIPVDMARMHRRAAWNALRAGRRLRALRHYGDAIRCGDWRSLGRAAVALGHPAVGTDRLFDLLGRDEAWIARAQEWLEPLARLERNPA
jgi:glycosyltransferase involved in cell wall biosynthesis